MNERDARTTAARQTSERSVTYRWLQPGDEPALLDLVRDAFGSWPRVDVTADPLDHLRWKLQSDPDASRYSNVAELDGRIIATQLLFVQPVTARGRAGRMIQGVDLCVHPEYQGRGVMAALRRFAWPGYEDAFDMRIGQTGQEALNKLRRREGSLPVGNSVQVLAAYPGRAAQRSPSVRRIDAFDERIDAFCRDALAQFDFAIARSKRYLDWRYDRRAGSFTINVVEEGDRIGGCAVTRISNGRGHIADTLALPGRLDAVDALVAHALADFASAGIERVECWLPARHPYREVFAARGFTEHRRTIPMTFGSFGDFDVDFLSSPDASMHYMSGDIDLV